MGRPRSGTGNGDPDTLINVKNRSTTRLPRFGELAALAKIPGPDDTTSPDRDAERIAELQRRNIELERTCQELQAFSHQMSHDLRAPVRAIQHFSEILRSDHARALDSNGRNVLGRLNTSARRLTSLIDNLVVLSEVGQGELRRELVDLTTAARQIVDALLASDPTRVINVRVADGLTASCDGRLATVVLENLLGNAWKFTGKRAYSEITFERDHTGDFVVRDNGIGFDPTDGGTIFEPFHRLHVSSDFEGAGIGLAIVRRIIERHRGRVSAHGVVDGGATIRFTLEPRPETSP